MRTTKFPGFYQDSHGRETIEWSLRSDRFEFRPGREIVDTSDLGCVIRGVELHSSELDDLSVTDRAAAEAAGLTLARGGDNVTGCLIGGELPMELEIDGIHHPTALHFTLDLGYTTDDAGSGHRNHLHLSLPTPLGLYEIAEQSFEDGLQRISNALPPEAKLNCCLNCRWSRYGMYSVPTIGLSCHRDSRERLRSVQNQHQLANMPPTEWVPDTYLCDQFERSPSQRADRSGGVTVSPLI